MAGEIEASSTPAPKVDYDANLNDDHLDLPVEIGDDDDDSFADGGRGLHYDRLGRSGARIMVYRKTPPPLPWPSGPHVAGYKIKYYTYSFADACETFSPGLHGAKDGGAACQAVPSSQFPATQTIDFGSQPVT